MDWIGCSYGTSKMLLFLEHLNGFSWMPFLTIPMTDAGIVLLYDCCHSHCPLIEISVSHMCISLAVVYFLHYELRCQSSPLH